MRNASYYEAAFTIRASGAARTENYERLEFLGDSILGSVISCYLFATYPKATEGFLTQMKSKIVNRKNLNQLGEKLALQQLIRNAGSQAMSENIHGNLFEALIGAIYLDLGYAVCERVILERLLPKEEIVKLEHKIASYKSLLLEWSQKNKEKIRYETNEEVLPHKQHVFRTTIWLNDQKITSATENSKKKAEEKAAQRAFYALNKNGELLGKYKAPAR